MKNSNIFYICDICKKELKSEKGLSVHKSKIHSKSLLEKQLKAIKSNNMTSKVYYTILTNPSISNYELKKKLRYSGGIDGFVRSLKYLKLLEIKSKKYKKRLKNQLVVNKKPLLLYCTEIFSKTNFSDENKSKKLKIINYFIFENAIEGVINSFSEKNNNKETLKGNFFNRIVTKFEHFAFEFRRSLPDSTLLNFYREYYKNPRLSIDELDDIILKLENIEIKEIIDFLKENIQLDPIYFSAFLTFIFRPYYLDRKSIFDLSDFQDGIKENVKRINDRFSSPSIENALIENYWKEIIEPFVKMNKNFLDFIGSRKDIEDKKKMIEIIKKIPPIIPENKEELDIICNIFTKIQDSNYDPNELDESLVI